MSAEPRFPPPEPPPTPPPIARAGRRVRLALSLLVATAGTPVVAAPPQEGAIDESERETLVAALQRSADELGTLLAGLSPEQLHYRPAATAWSVAEITEHLVKAETAILSTVTGPLLHSPARPEWRPEGRAMLEDHAVRMAITNRDDKRFSAPPFLAPTEGYADAALAAAAFHEVRAATLTYVRTTGDPLRLHFARNPPLGMVDGYQWLLFVAAHTERHVAQARDVLADPAFPSGAPPRPGPGRAEAGSRSPDRPSNPPPSPPRSLATSLPSSRPPAHGR